MQILHRPLSHDYYPARVSAKAAGMVASFKEMFPHAIPGIVSLTTWKENTAMMVALRDEAERKAIPFHVLDAVGLPADDRSAGLNCARSSHLTPGRHPVAPDTVMWGHFHETDHDAFPLPANLLWNSRELVDLVHRWAETGIFESMAGQTFVVLSPSPQSVRQAMQRFQKAGHHYASLKCSKIGWVHFLDLSQDIPDEVELQIAGAAEKNGMLLLQIMLDPLYEYRIFVVGGEVVTGAGCLDGFTPVDHITDHPFDLRMEKYRGDGSSLVEMRELTAGYLDFAREFAGLWASKVSSETSYALDMCWDGQTREIVPMDLLPLANSGLYASSTQRLAKAFCAGFA